MINKKLLLLFLILTYHFVSGQNNNTVTVDIQNESSLTLVGSTNIAPFHLIQTGDKLSNKKINVSISHNKGQIIFGKNQLSLSVVKFSSDNPIAYHDFMQLLKAKIFPDLFVELECMTLQPNCNKVANSINGHASIAITITGVTKQFVIPFIFSRNGDIITVEGTQKMSIRDFNLVPPTKLLGLVRTSEMIDVKFHFIFKMNKNDFI